MKVAIVGAGPAGITAAYQLVKGGAEVEVFDAEDAVGGLARSIDLWGQRVDLGPHRFFSSDPRISGLWHEVLGDDYHMVNRLTRIYYRRRFFYYPLQPVNALVNMGLFEAARCLGSYLSEKIAPARKDKETFESWVVGRFGRRLYEMFFKSYTEKLWGIPCSELDADFAAQRIKKFSLGEAIKSVLGLGKKKHKTLVDCFAYPIAGAGMVYDRMAQRVQEAGGRGQATVFARNLRLGLLEAPLVNGQAAHVLDYDDTHIEGIVHSGVTVIPTALAAGEETAADGRAVLTAIIAGFEVLTRLGIAALRSIPGRMERIDEGQNFTAIVDFAHTPNALDQSIAAARTMTDGQVIVTFGCAGLRDREKRTLMGEVAGRAADKIIVTAEDPRTESLEGILEEMAAGARSRGGRRAGEVLGHVGRCAAGDRPASNGSRPGALRRGRRPGHLVGDAGGVLVGPGAPPA